MKIKTKLVISFCIILFVPILLAGGVIIGFQTIQMKAIEKTYGIQDAGAYSLTNSIQLLNKMTEGDFANVQKLALDTPKELLDHDYLRSLNNDLKDKFSYVVVRNEMGEVVYNGGDNSEEFVESLPVYGETDETSNVSTYLDGEDEILI